jgi:hypothetical protein
MQKHFYLNKNLWKYTTTHTPPAKNARLTGRAGTHYFWEFLMLFLAVFCGFSTSINFLSGNNLLFPGRFF